MGDWGLRSYGQLYEKWPRDEAGEPVVPAFLSHCSPLDFEAETLQGMLEAYGIPSVRCLPGDGQFGELILGMSGNGVDIFVPQTLLADAEELVKGDPDHDEMEE